MAMLCNSKPCMLYKAINAIIRPNTACAAVLRPSKLNRNTKTTVKNSAVTSSLTTKVYCSKADDETRLPPVALTFVPVSACLTSPVPDVLSAGYQQLRLPLWLALRPFLTFLSSCCRLESFSRVICQQLILSYSAYKASNLIKFLTHL